MQLRVARMCLDCEELHDAQQCPICASESFAYLTRWIPVDERRQQRRSPAPPAEAPASAPAPSRARWMKRGVAGAAGVVLIAAGQWAWRSIKNSRDAEFTR